MNRRSSWTRPIVVFLLVDHGTRGAAHSSRSVAVSGRCGTASPSGARCSRQACRRITPTDESMTARVLGPATLGAEAVTDRVHDQRRGIGAALRLGVAAGHGAPRPGRAAAPPSARTSTATCWSPGAASVTRRSSARPAIDQARSVAHLTWIASADRESVGREHSDGLERRHDPVRGGWWSQPLALRQPRELRAAAARWNAAWAATGRPASASPTSPALQTVVRTSPVCCRSAWGWPPGPATSTTRSWRVSTSTSRRYPSGDYVLVHRSNPTGTMQESTLGQQRGLGSNPAFEAQEEEGLGDQGIRSSRTCPSTATC